MTTAPTPRPRQLEGVYRAPPLHWVGDGFRVHGYFSAIPDADRKLSPFLMLDYHPPHHYPAAEHRRGVGVHPHRGIETVTLAFEGSVEHHDSAGGGGIIGPGDVQWMTAAAGILHKEHHETEFGRRGGVFHMAQLWVNLPRVHKMAPPAYQPITADEMGHVTLPEGAGTVRLVSGELHGVRGPAQTFSPVLLWDAQLHAGGSLRFDLPASHNLGVLVMSGNVTLERGVPAAAGEFVVYANAGEQVSITATAESRLLLMGGEPINEPVVAWGPFVMNSVEEIRQAVHDYNAGLFGQLDD